MADVNNCSRKRSISNSDTTTEASNDQDLSEVAKSPAEIVEPAAKIVRIGDVCEKGEHNLENVATEREIVSNIEATDSSQDIQKHDEELEALRQENMKLRLELEKEMPTSSCNCTLDVNINNEADAPLITIKFHHESIADSYRSAFQNFLKTFKDFKHTTTDLEIHISKSDADGLDNSDSTDNFRKRKRKKSKSKDLFVLDTTPSLATKEHSDMKYVSKYMVQTAEDMEKAPEVKGNASVCWNCEKSHNLRDCPEPKDFEKIKNARNKMRAQQVLKPRYHLDEEQKYSHLKPGKISEQLMEALGVRNGELPPYIYRMRTVGYPPGWMEEAKIQHSNMSLYDMEGKEDSRSKKSEFVDIDPEKVVEYPGFNTPMDDGMRDDYRYHDCPPFSERCSKQAMLTYLKQMAAKATDNLETCDMDLDTNTENLAEIVVPPVCKNDNVNDEDSLRRSPSLTDLEKKKLELLAELDNGNSNSNSVEVRMTLDDVITEIVTNEESSEGNNKEKDVLLRADDNSEMNLIVENLDETTEICDKTAESVPLDGGNHGDDVKLSVFGTPIIKTSSPYSRLPHAEKFSKDISPVINFENLPNSTGKYEQMTNVLQKVRNTLKNLNEKC